MGLLAAPAAAAPVEPTGQLAVTPNRLDSFGAGVVDQASERYLLADRSNKSLDVFDVAAGRMLAQVGGFVGDTGVGATSGPNGVVVAGGEAWVGDGDGSVKVVDLVRGAVVQSIPTGVATRVGAVAWDAVDRVFVGVSDAETPPFATLVSTEAGRPVVGKVVVDRATAGLGQPVWSPLDGLVYVAVPELDGQPGQGGIAVVDPRDARLVTVVEVKDCGGAGLARAPGGRLILGCQGGPAPHAVLFDLASGDAVVNVYIGAGAVAYGEQAGRFYVVAGPVVSVLDASNGRPVAELASGPGGQAAAIAEGSGAVLVPVAGTGGGCGCVKLFTSR